MAIYYGSVCSGIEATSVAWEPVGMKPLWFSETEPFPSAVLAAHWPQVDNLGDMTKIAAAVRAGDVPAPDLLVGGTPCQAFSVAGLRGGLSDERGQLTLSYVELADSIDEKREQNGEQPAIIVWENVPGVLSSKDNAFGCFLAGLAGESEELKPAGKNGQTLVMCLDQKELSRGGSSMLNISESRSAAVVCSLSQVLEQTSVPQKYFLSTTACTGILRRAEKRGRQLPLLLKTALAQQAQTTTRHRPDI
ncbi:DNA cytosine methyltransferase [Morganella morganii]|uniref:DNA cytosine methyltransferase n=1 Tax=Morganella morganii TaxID=582 RepID=UPI003EBE4039